MNQKRSTQNYESGPVTAKATPAVPISVYRELAAELQATQTMLDSLHAQNRHLRKANQQMQLELDHIIDSAHKMQQISAPSPRAAQSPTKPMTATQSKKVRRGPAGMGSSDVGPAAMSPSELPQVDSHASQGHVSHQAGALPAEALEPVNPPSPRPKPRKRPPTAKKSDREIAIEALNKLFTGREESRPRPKLSPDGSQELNTWWLVVMVLFIVVTAFGTGFLLVRPFLNTQPQQQLVGPN